MKLQVLYKKPIILALLIFITYILLFLDTLKYPGFVAKHFLIDARVFFAVSVTLLLIRPASSRLIKFIFKTSFAVMDGALLLYVWFSIEEAIHFTNYVLSKYHFSLEGLIYILLFSVAVFLTSKIKLKKLAVVNGRIFWQIAFLFFVAYTLIVNTGASLKNAIDGDLYAFTHLSASYDQKMYYQWHDFYFYMLFIKNNTPESASIIIPPQLAPWWTSTGNLSLVRYFLYPRKILQYNTEVIPDIKSIPIGTYIMVAWGQWGCDQYGCKGWPVQTIKAQEAIFKDPNSSGVKDIRHNFSYDPRDLSYPFGLLKL